MLIQPHFLIIFMLIRFSSPCLKWYEFIILRNYSQFYFYILTLQANQICGFYRLGLLMPMRIQPQLALQISRRQLGVLAKQDLRMQDQDFQMRWRRTCHSCVWILPMSILCLSMDLVSFTSYFSFDQLQKLIYTFVVNQLIFGFCFCRRLSELKRYVFLYF